MKKVLAFIKWHLDKWSLTQRLWMIAGACFGFGLPDYLKTNEINLALKIAFTMWAIIFLKWFVWDMITDSWKRFENERRDLFKTIDEGK